jgi:tetrahydromethanopterin S-methyltransferase subunit G
MSSNVEERIARLEGVYEQVRDRLNGIDVRLAAIDRTLETRFALIETRFGQIEQKIDSRFAWLLGIVITSWITTLLAILFRH